MVFFFPRAFLTAEHGFRAGRRLEEHLLTANLFVDKTLAANSPVWRLSLDLSKIFDRGDWGALWLAFVRTGGVNSYVMDFFKHYTLVNMVRSLDNEGTVVPFKSMQACDKDLC